MIQKLQNKILKMVNKNNFSTEKKTLNLDQLFAYESLKYYYEGLKDRYLNSSSIRRNKSILLPKIDKALGCKSSYIRAIILYNSLPNNLKTLGKSKSMKNKLKSWISLNITLHLIHVDLNQIYTTML